MSNKLHEGKTFHKVNYANKQLVNNEFSNCYFVDCDFSKSNFSQIDFVDCEFESCNFSLTILKYAGLKDVHFKDCKIVGVDFSACNDFLFAVQFTDCSLDYATFHSRKMKNTRFTNSIIKEVDFSEADLTQAVFQNCDLTRSIFDRSILDKADFSSAINFDINPERNRIKKTIFSSNGLIGLLTKYDLVIKD
ncbi:pentapeptide repeat-containing protein [Fluviicola chungangensis]|uniref:Pentapeptide repeat-containing protein n=1 Tax=Fluviicola chungangensis TaxID=2597671 RepID=A0A556N6K6_9FLAO|nr:pentapeptide repeat-containing protein [Fluviicola chungangensis]TSJ47775.1 pentapeptide repeat-containing protein [Fluviicola chungangensis]